MSCPFRAHAIKRTNTSSDTFQHFASKILILPLANRWIIVPKQKENDAQHSQKQHLQKFNEISRSTHLVDWIPPKKKTFQLSDEPWLTKGQGAMTSRIITLAVAASALAVAASALAFSASALAVAASASSRACSASYQHFSVTTAYNTW